MKFTKEQRKKLLCLTKFQQKVLIACSKIPKGKTSTYKEIARAIGRPRAARAVGNALAKNPLAPIIPCHRVVRSDGTSGGYKGKPRSYEKLRLLNSDSICPHQ